MVPRFLLAMAILSGIRAILPTEVFASLPSIVVTCVEILPALLCALVIVNLSFPPKTIEAGGYALLPFLLVPMVLLYDTIKRQLILLYPTYLTKGMDVWSLQALLTNASAVLLLNLLVMILFLVLWRACFKGGLRFRMRFARLLNPLFWIAAYLGCALLTYFDLLVHAQHLSETRYQLYLGAPQISNSWYQVGPIVHLIALHGRRPLETFLLGFMLLFAMGMIRSGYVRAYPKRKAEPATMEQPGPLRPSYLDGPAERKRTPAYIPENRPSQSAMPQPKALGHQAPPRKERKD